MSTVASTSYAATGARWRASALAAALIGGPPPGHGIGAAKRRSLVLTHVVAMAGVFIPRCQRTAVERTVSRRVGWS